MYKPSNFLLCLLILAGFTTSTHADSCLKFELERLLQCNIACPGDNGRTLGFLLNAARQQLTDERFGGDLEIDVFDNQPSRVITFHLAPVRETLAMVPASQQDLVKRNLGHLGANKLNIVVGTVYMLESNSQISVLERQGVERMAEGLTGEYHRLRNSPPDQEIAQRLAFEKTLGLVFNFQAPPKESDSQKDYFLDAAQRYNYLNELPNKPK